MLSTLTLSTSLKLKQVLDSKCVCGAMLQKIQGIFAILYNTYLTKSFILSEQGDAKFITQISKFFWRISHLKTSLNKYNQSRLFLLYYRVKQVEFPNDGFTMELPKQMALTNIATRSLYIRYDFLSSRCSTYAYKPPKPIVVPDIVEVWNIVIFCSQLKCFRLKFWFLVPS